MAACLSFTGLRYYIPRKSENVTSKNHHLIPFNILLNNNELTNICKDRREKRSSCAHFYRATLLRSLFTPFSLSFSTLSLDNDSRMRECGRDCVFSAEFSLGILNAKVHLDATSLTQFQRREICIPRVAGPLPLHLWNSRSVMLSV